jgi:hypothetical protein
MLQKAFLAQTFKAALELAQAIVAMYEKHYPEAMKCLAGLGRDSQGRSSSQLAAWENNIKNAVCNSDSGEGSLRTPADGLFGPIG